jgi:Zn-finger nucleic acid-binding protein
MHSDQDSYRCDYCHTVFVPDKNAEGVIVLAAAEPAQPCPTCSQPLKDAAVAHIAILYCDQCCGMAIPMAIFETVIALLSDQQSGLAVEPPPLARDLTRRIACPHCARTMDTHPYAGRGNVVIDSCETCLLLWLDHGELKRIARASADCEPAHYA